MKRMDQVGFGTGFICIALSLLAALGMSVRYLPDLRAGGLSNPDSYMRMVRLRDMLNSGTMLDTVARDGSGHGTVLHWSHLLDSLLCLLAVPFGLFLNPDAALHVAALIFGPLNIAALGFAVAWAAAPFAERKWLWLGAILPALSPAIISYGMAGVVHHHVAIAIVAVACWGWAARLISGRANASAGIALGAWAALGIWFTPESVPLTMMAFGALGLAWIAAPGTQIPRAIACAGLSFALVTTLALLVDPPAGGMMAMEIDRLSILFVGLAVAVAATGIGLWVADPLVPDLAPRIAAACAIALVCAIAWALTFHGAIFTSNMLLDEDQRDVMFGSINEMLPIDGALPSMHFLLTGACAAVMVTVWAARRRSLFLAYVAVCLIGLLWLAWSHVRFAAYPEVAGAIALPIALTLATSVTLRWHQIGQSFARLATILLFVQVPYMWQLSAAAGSAQAAPVSVPSCAIADATTMLAPYPDEVVLADVNDTPEILYRTQVRTVGSLYHRDMRGFLRLRAAWRTAPSKQVPEAIDAAEIALVLGCKTPGRSALVADIPTPTLLDQVRTGAPPPWLRQIAENARAGQVLYQVIRRSEPGSDAAR